MISTVQGTVRRLRSSKKLGWAPGLGGRLKRKELWDDGLAGCHFHSY